MKIEVTVAGKPYRSKAVGEAFLVTPVEAKVLVALKRVTYSTKDAVVEVPVPQAVEIEAEVARPRRVYRRRDLSAE